MIELEDHHGKALLQTVKLRLSCPCSVFRRLASRFTVELEHPVAFCIDQHAARIGRPINTHITINFACTGCDPRKAVKAFAKIRQNHFAKWTQRLPLRYRHEATGAYAFENYRDGIVYMTMEPGDPHNVHVHWAIDVYGPGYAAHGTSGRLHTLLDLNTIKTKDALTGKEEAKAFEDKEYVRLHQSTLKKVDVVDNLLDRFINGNLKTQARWLETYGFHPAIILELAKNYWVFSIIGVLIAIASIVGLFFPDFFPALVNSSGETAINPNVAVPST